MSVRDDTGRGLRGTGQSAVGGAIAYLFAKVMGWDADLEAVVSLTVLASVAVTWAQLLLERGRVRRLWR